MLLKIPRLYDSHGHFIATGQFAGGLHLGSLLAAEDLARIDGDNPDYLRGDWLVGFGWDEKEWPTPPHKDLLDQWFPHRAVFLARKDGHRSWVNSKALAYFGIDSPDGILLEKDHLRAWDHLPEYTKTQQKGHIRAACREYNKGGFTHVRDLSCTESLWNLLVEMSEADELTVAIEENYTTHDIQDFDRLLQLCLQAKKAETSLVRMKGIKLFYDGSLGSQTAYLSKPYYGKEEQGRGAPLWPLAQVEEVIKKTWQAGLEFSVHVIGDQAAHEMVELARKVSAQGFVGRLNLEHAQILRPETIQMMKPLHVRCHMQPCHWLSDRAWLKDKLGELFRYAFPWEALRAAQIPISLGCDSPVEPPTFWRNHQALKESASAGIKKFAGDIIQAHSHPDGRFADSFTVIEGDAIKEISFLGRTLEL